MNFSVPDEVGIVGFDDLSIVSAAMQSLTTVHYSTQAIAEEAMKILLRRMAGGAYEGQVQRISSYLIGETAPGLYKFYMRQRRKGAGFYLSQTRG